MRIIIKLATLSIECFQVQFDAYETEKHCSIAIRDDTVFEGPESFTVHLAVPTDTLLGNCIKIFYVCLKYTKERKKRTWRFWYCHK